MWFLGGWGGHLYRDFGGLCFFGRNGCFVVVDVYFTVFVAFDVALKTEIDQRQKSSKNVINRVLLLHDGITWLHYYTKPNEKKIIKESAHFKLSLVSGRAPYWRRSKRGQHRTQTTMSVCA